MNIQFCVLRFIFYSNFNLMSADIVTLDLNYYGHADLWFFDLQNGVSYFVLQ